jgi:DNA-directed RNA polymerase subunit RPC12/RpoP
MYTSEETFALVGNETRARILEALGDAHGPEGDPPRLPFTELRSRVATDVDSSQFNYHLQELVGDFIDRTEDGYRMRPEGTTLYRTIRAGTFARDESVAPFEVGCDCHFCGAPIETRHEDSQLHIECSDCKHQYLRTVVPTDAVNNDIESLRRIDQHARHRLLASSRGVCRFCASALETRFLTGSETLPSRTGLDVDVHQHCEHCGYQHYMKPGLAVLYDPNLVSFCHEHELDVMGTPFWELGFAVTNQNVTIQSTDPWELRFTLTLDGETLVLDIDENLTVTEQAYSL